MLDLLESRRLPQGGFVRQEDVALGGEFLGNRFGLAYAAEGLANVA